MLTSLGLFTESTRDQICCKPHCILLLKLDLRSIASQPVPVFGSAKLRCQVKFLSCFKICLGLHMKVSQCEAALKPTVASGNFLAREDLTDGSMNYSALSAVFFLLFFFFLKWRSARAYLFHTLNHGGIAS